LVLVTAKNCGHCRELVSTTWPQLSKQLSDAFPQLTIIHINKDGINQRMQELNDQYGRPYPDVLNNWALWFPTLFLVREEDWNTGITSRTPVFIYNGQLVNGMAQSIVKSGVPVNNALITNWIQTSLPNFG
jgi:thiol-disulfide isomerase/thioredoxin